LTTADREVTAQQAIQIGARLVRRGEVERGIACFRQVMALDRNDPGLLGQLAAALQRACHGEEAITLLRRATALRPALAELQFNLATSLRTLGDLDGAIQHYRYALALRPHDTRMHVGLAVTLMQAGQWAEGLAGYEHRPTRRKFLKSIAQGRVPLWQGEPLDGRRILLVTEQGAGDVVQFIRYAGLLARQGGEVHVVCPPALVPLVAGADGVAVAAATPNARVDFVEQVMSLPYRLGTRPDSIPARVPYLHADAVPARAVGGSRPRVGIAWSGDPRHPRDLWRSSPLDAWMPLLHNPRFEFFSLQAGPRARDLQQAGSAIVDLAAGFKDFADTAAAVSGLDLVISVDTAICHIAGALGRPVWTLLAADPDWRWLRQGEHTAWYPTMRLFRQRRLGDWIGVLTDVAAALGSFSA
jgi:hypothetical protein